jgi:ribosomal protein L37AE/L43A
MSKRQRKCCPVCGSLAVYKYTGVAMYGKYRCLSCGAKNITPVLKDILHNAKGLATGDRVIL